VKVKDVMTPNPVTIGSEETASKAAKEMMAEKVSSLLVVDEEGKVIGILTDRLLGLYLGAHNQPAHQVKVKDFMEENVISVSPEMKLAKAAKILEELEIRYLPVVEGDKLVGILSISDLAALIDHYIDCILMELGARVKKAKGKKI
jgi:CBS domain-containing protein